jgi:stage V sporulation protein R
LTFIDEFFTEDFCFENEFFSFARNASSGNYEIDSREFKKIKNKLLFQLTNFGEPFIYVQDGNYDNRGELLLRHRHEGVDLHLDHSRATMASLYRVWHRPICLLTAIDGKPRLLRFDGTEHADRPA